MNLYTKQQHIKNGIFSAERKPLSGTYPEHGHDFFEIEYIISGTGNYIIDGIRYPIHSNMLFFLSPASFHAIENSDAEIINVMFPCSLCDSSILFRLVSHKVKSISFAPDDSSLIEMMLMEIVNASLRKDTSYAVQFLCSLLYKLAALTPQLSIDPVSHIQNAIIYILENFRSNITLQNTADYVGLVPAYLSTLFLQETGINFKTYVDNLRFDYAANLLASTKLSILEVCTQSGFIDYANFTRRFRNKYGLSPKAYRLQNCT